jgi:hypothetical protein
MEEYFGHRMIFIMVGTLVCWVAVTLGTPPVAAETLDGFYQHVRPPGWWRPVRQRLGAQPDVGINRTLACWIVMLIGIYGPLIGLLKLAFGDMRTGLPCTLAGVAAIGVAIALARSMYHD